MQVSWDRSQASIRDSLVLSQLVATNKIKKITSIPGFKSAVFDVRCQYRPFGICIQNPFDFILGHQLKYQIVLSLDECFLI